MGCQNSVQAKEKRPSSAVSGATMPTPPPLSLINLKQHEDLYDSLESARREALLRAAKQTPLSTSLPTTISMRPLTPTTDQVCGVEDDWLRRTSAAALKRHIRLEGDSALRLSRRESKSPKAFPPVSLSPLTPSILRHSDVGSHHRSTPNDKSVKFAPLLVSPTTIDGNSGPRTAGGTVGNSSSPTFDNRRRHKSPMMVGGGGDASEANNESCVLLALSPISPPPPAPLLLSRPMEDSSSDDDEEEHKKRLRITSSSPNNNNNTSANRIGITTNTSVELSAIYSPEYSITVARNKQLLEVRMEDRALGLENSPHHNNSDATSTAASPSPVAINRKSMALGQYRVASSSSEGTAGTQGISKSPSYVANGGELHQDSSSLTATTHQSNNNTFYTVHSNMGVAPSVSRRLHSGAMSDSASPRRDFPPPIVTNRVSLATINPIQSFFPVIPNENDEPPTTAHFSTPPNMSSNKKKSDVNPLTNLNFGRGTVPAAVGGPRTEQDIIRQLLSGVTATTRNPIGMGVDEPHIIAAHKKKYGSSKGLHASLPPPAATFQQEQEALRQIAVEASGLSRDSLRMKRAIQRMFMTQHAAATASSSATFVGMDEDDQDSIRCGSVTTAVGSLKGSRKSSKKKSVDDDSRMDGTESCASFVTVRSNVPAMMRGKSSSVCASEVGSVPSIFLTTNCSTNAHLRNKRRQMTLTGGGMLFSKKKN